MQINLTEELNKDSLLSHIVLHGIAHSVNKQLTRELADEGKTEDGTVLDVVIMANGRELNLAHFVEHWQSQVREMINKKAKGLLDDKFGHLEDLITDLRDRVGTEIDKRLEEYEQPGEWKNAE